MRDYLGETHISVSKILFSPYIKLDFSQQKKNFINFLIPEKFSFTFPLCIISNIYLNSTLRV